MKSHRLNGKSFIFKLNEDNSLTKYEHNGGHREVYHSDSRVFDMNGPIAINDGRQAFAAMLGPWRTPKGFDTFRGLCGERYPELEDVEIFHLK